MIYLVYLAETDGDILIEPYNVFDDLMLRVRELKLHRSDYAVFEGSCVKGFS